MEGEQITGIKNLGSSVYHVPCTIHQGVPNFWSKCNRDISTAPLVAQRFFVLEDRNLCQHCVAVLIREGA